MHLKPGDKVSFLFESGDGVVIDIIDNKTLLVLDNHGFEKKYNEKYLVPFVSSEYTFAPGQIERKIESSKPNTRFRGKQKNPVWSIDLHIEELIADHRRMMNSEILALQMEHFKNFLKKAKAKRIQKIVAIHGVGEGILRTEIRHYLNQFEFEYHDADYSQYGFGGTEVLLRFS